MRLASGLKLLAADTLYLAGDADSAETTPHVGVQTHIPPACVSEKGKRRGKVGVWPPRDDNYSTRDLVVCFSQPLDLKG